MSATTAYAAVAAIVAAALAWMEWRGSGRLRAWRVLAAVVSVICLLLLAWRPTRARRGEPAPVTILTPGPDRGSPAADFAIGLTIEGIATAPDLGWIVRHRQSSSIRIVGWGLEEDEWPDLSEGVEAEPPPPPAGVVSIAWPSSITLGDEAVVRGRLGAPVGKTRVVLADGSGTLDSITVPEQDPRFTLRARPRATGHWRPALRVESHGVPAESLAIEVRPAPPLRVLLVESSPSFETRFLRDWLAAQGAEVGTRTRVTRGRTRATGVNTAPTAALTRGTLDRLDLLVVRGPIGTALGASEARAVEGEVRMRGLGLVLMMDDTALTAGFGAEVLARDSAGAPTIVVVPVGGGRIARATVSAVSRRLRGDSTGYAELWSRILGSVRRRPDAAVSVDGEGPRFPNRPALIVARGERGPKELRVEASDGTTDTVYLAATPWDSSTRRGVFWPPRTGWYRVGGPEGTALFVHDTAEWMAMQAQRRIDATRARVGPSRRRDPAVTREPIPLWPVFLGFLTAAGFLWWAHLRLDGAGAVREFRRTSHPKPTRRSFMDSRIHRVPLVALAGLALASCRSDKAPGAAADAPDTAATASAATAAPSAVTVVTTDFSFDAPAELPAGLTTFRLVNRGPQIHHVQLVKLGEGKTMDDFMAALKAGGPPPKWISMEGGPNPSEIGDTSVTTVALEPGNYAMICFVPGPDGIPHVVKGMARPLTVTAAAGAAAAEPEADVVMKLVDYDFELSKPIPAGRHTIRVENAGPQEHEVVIVKLDSGKEAMDFAKWGEKLVGKPPGTLHGGSSGIMPGDKVFVEVDLAPGQYGLICFVPDSKDGKMHAHHGMAKTVTVS